METDNIFTEIVKEMQDEIAGLRDDREKATPFMQEQVTRREYVKRLDEMSPGERKQILSEIGPDGLNALLRGK
jgi:heme oxygenase